MRLNFIKDTVWVLLYLHWGKSIVFQEWEPDDRHQQELHTERVVLWVERVPEAHVDQVAGSVGQSQEHHLRAEQESDYCSCEHRETLLVRKTCNQVQAGVTELLHAFISVGITCLTEDKTSYPKLLLWFEFFFSLSFLNHHHLHGDIF